MYGQIGTFQFNGGSGRATYGPAGDDIELQARASEIKIIPESRQDDPVFQEIRQWFDWAEVICFLGFGFDPMNLDRLGLPSVQQWQRGNGKPRAEIFASVFGMTPVEIGIAQSRVAPGETWRALDTKNLLFLRSIQALKD